MDDSTVPCSFHVVDEPRYVRRLKATHLHLHAWLVSQITQLGRRPKHFVRVCECPVRFMVQIDSSMNGKYLEVTNGFYHHNHALDKVEFKTYSENCGVVASVLGSRVYEYLLSQGENVVKKDVDNIVQELKWTRRTATTVRRAHWHSVNSSLPKKHCDRRRDLPPRVRGDQHDVDAHA